MNVSTGASPTILIAEDNESVAKMLCLCLREAGFDVTGVTTGGEALKILQQQQPDGAVLDLQLRNGQGGAVLDWLRKSEKQIGSVPVWVVISALDREEATRRYGPLGNHFLAKPFDPWDLVAMLWNLLSAKREPP